VLHNLSLEERKESFDQCMSEYKERIVICAGTGCVANGALEIYARFLEVIEKKGLTIAVTLQKEKADMIISESGCQGFCQMGPLVTIYPRGILYTKVK
jgi:NADH-quinone oxidoreductase subunit F